MADSAKMVTVTCPNHHRELTSRLWNLLQTENGLDYELRCGERGVRAHGMMLQAFLSTAESPHLVPVQEAADGERPANDDLLLSILKFLYKGTVTVMEEKLDELQTIASQLDFRLLVDAVEVTKRCETPMIEVLRVDEALVEKSPESGKPSAKRSPADKSDRGREPMVKKPRLITLKADAVSSGGDRSDASGSLECQPVGSDSDSEKSTSVSRHTTPLNFRRVSARLSSIQFRAAAIGVQSVAFRCDVCDFEAPTITHLTFHKANKHDVSILIYRCSICRARFVSAAKLENHVIKTHTKDRGRNCKQAKTDYQMLKCIRCEYQSESRIFLDRHQREAHRIDADGKSLPAMGCPDCNFTTLIPAVLREHWHRKHGAPALTCKSCKAQFNSRGERDSHSCTVRDSNDDETPNSSSRSLAHTPVDEQHSKEDSANPEAPPDDEQAVASAPVRCRFCYRRFHTAAARREHMRDHPKHKCTKCDYQSLSRTYLDQHRVNVHLVDGKGNPLPVLKCFYCDFSTRIPESLRRHRFSKHRNSTFTCKLCKSDFKSEAELNEHVTNHQKLKCNLCDYETPDAVGLDHHRLSDHSVDATGKAVTMFKCAECNYETLVSDNLRMHQYRKHGRSTQTDADLGLEKMNTFNCRFCCRKFATAESKRDHVANHFRHKCSVCEYKSPSRRRLEQHQNYEHHIDVKGNPLSLLECSEPECDFSTLLPVHFRVHRYRKHHIATMKCKFCNVHCKSDADRYEHMSQEHTRCSACDYEASDSADLSQHLVSVHGVDDKGVPLPVFRCSECDFTATVSRTVIRHVTIRHPGVPCHDGIVRQQCPYCRKVCKSVDDLEEHLANHELYKCNLCEFEAKKKFQLQEHKRRVHSVHYSGKPMPIYNCSLCKFTTKMGSVLKYHTLAVHSGLKPYKCPYCSHASGRKPEITRHIKSVHLVMRNFRCKLCDYAGRSKYDLSRHMLRHTGEKPYKCEFCDAAFPDKVTLTGHRRIHTGEPRPHVCHKCGRGFNRKDTLVTHLKHVHKNDRD